MSFDCDFLVIGAGIAGLSVAARLASEARVIVLEQEAQTAYHTSGRSAAMYLEAYGPYEIRQLTTASRHDFEQGLQSEADNALLTPRAVYNIARPEQMGRYRSMVDDPVYKEKPQEFDAADTLVEIPLLKPGYAEASFTEPGACEIDVHELLQVFTRRFRNAGGRVETNARVTGLSSTADGWAIESTAGSFKSPIVVNCAGAWADQLAGLAGIAPLGLQPKRRTIAVVEPVVATAVATDLSILPFVADVDESFYIKPENGRLLISPADETPIAPCDVQPDSLDIAVAIDRVERAFEMEFERVQQSWAGLRSFFADGVPTCGFDPRCNGFFWLAGQGGYGIQTAPALSAFAASLLLGDTEFSTMPGLAELTDLQSALSPTRLIG